MDVREKMVASGDFFESKVGTECMAVFNCRILYNKRYYSGEIGRGRECDILVVTPHTIYCVECKNYKGFISCDYYSSLWTFGSSGKKGRVQNPYLSNSKHVRSIRGNMYRYGITPYNIESVIVVPNGCKIHNDDSSICPVLSLNSLLSKIESDSIIRPVVYDIVRVAEFLEAIACS